MYWNINYELIRDTERKLYKSNDRDRTDTSDAAKIGDDADPLNWHFGDMIV